MTILKMLLRILCCVVEFFVVMRSPMTYVKREMENDLREELWEERMILNRIRMKKLREEDPVWREMRPYGHDLCWIKKDGTISRNPTIVIK